MLSEGVRSLCPLQMGRIAELDPVDAFVLMEDASAADLCFLVDASLGAIRKVRISLPDVGAQTCDVRQDCEVALECSPSKLALAIDEWDVGATAVTTW
jgi:hypothetical protein